MARPALSLAALLMLAARPARADDAGYAMAVGLGGGFRPGLPGAYKGAGDALLPLVSLEFTGSRLVWRSVSIAASAAWTPHRLDVNTDTGVRSYDFTLYHLAAGAAATAHPLPSLSLAAGLEAALLLARWEAPAVGSCGPDCVIIGESPGDAGNEVHLGALARARALRVWRGSSEGSDDDFGVGVEARLVGASEHSSGIPLSHGVILVVLAYGRL